MKFRMHVQLLIANLVLNISFSIKILYTVEDFYKSSLGFCFFCFLFFHFILFLLIAFSLKEEMNSWALLQKYIEEIAICILCLEMQKEKFPSRLFTIIYLPFLNCRHCMVSLIR